MWAHLRLRNKILVLFVILSVIPIITVNGIWLRYSQDQLKQAAADRQDVLLSSIAQRINSYIATRVNGVTATSQEIDVAALNVEAARVRLLQYSNQDNEVLRVALADRDGNELLVVEDGSIREELQNIKDELPFQVVTFVTNKPRIGQLQYRDGLPFVTISVPLLSQGELGDQDFTSTESLARRFGADIRGALIVDIDLSELWTLVLEAELGSDGYMYLVNNDGIVLVHPDQSFTAERTNLSTVEEIKDALEILREFNLDAAAENFQPNPSISISETDTTVLSSSYPISQSAWSLIAQEPVSSVYSAVNRIALVAVLIFIFGVPIAFLLVLFATQTIINPIRELSRGVVRMSSGDFTKPISVTGNDELSLLARSFNGMGSNLQALLERLRKQNLNLVAEQAKLQAVLDTIADGVVVLDQLNRIVLINRTMAAFVNEVDKEELLGKDWLSIFTLYYEDAPFTSEHLKGDNAYFHDVTLRVGDEQKFIDITVVRILNDPHGIVFILTVQDTTPRRELENMKLDFVSMAAHELRTPLTAISGYLKLIGSDDASPEERKSFADLANSNANMLEGLINNMLSLSRIERDSLVINRAKVNWKEIVKEETESFSFSASARGIKIDIDLPEEDLYVWGDEVALREVLGNLVSNAIHYSDDNQQVTVKTMRNSADIKTTVSDHGIGIPDRLHSKLFTKYYRAKGGLTTNSQGTGIGLFISKSIIDAHGGVIDFDSTFGQGSDFYFTVEAYDEDKDRQEVKDSGTIEERSTHE